MVGLVGRTVLRAARAAALAALSLAPGAFAQVIPAERPATTAPVTGPTTAPATNTAIAPSRDAAVLLRAPNTPHPDRDEAARRLVLRQTPEAREALRAALVDIGNTSAQLAAARAIALDPDPDENLKVPLRALVGPDARLTEAAIIALAGFDDDPDIRNYLIQLATDSSRDGRAPAAARLSAIQALSAVPEKPVAAALVRVLGDEAEPAAIRVAAATALAEMTGFGSTPPDAASWQQWWQDNQAKDAETLARELLESRSTRLARLQRRFDRLAQESATLLVEAYQSAPENRRERMLLRYLRGAEPEVRAVGAELVQADFKQARPIPQSVRDQLRTMIGDSSSQVRVRVANALFLLNDDQAIEALLAQLETEGDAAVRRELAQALVPTRDPRVIRPLLRLLQDRSLAVAEVATRGLGDTENLTPLILKDPALAREVADALRGAWQRRSTGPGTTPLRAALVSTMGTLEDPSFRSLFTELLRPQEPAPVRRAAIRALGDLGQPAAADTIVDVLRDPDPAIRAEAITALGKTADSSHAEVIFAFMNGESDERIGSSAWRVLSNIFAEAGEDPRQAQWLNRWADRFRDNSERRLEVLQVLAKRLQVDDKRSELAAVRQNMGEELMRLSAAAQQGGDTQDAEERAAQAATMFQLALEYFREKDPNDKDMITGSLREQRLAALLTSRAYDDASRFASESIAANPAHHETMGVPLKREVDRLQTAGQFDDALKLIESVKGMNPKLADQFLGPIERYEQEIRQRQGAAQS